MATINHKTYNEATETFKDFNVYDGKETLVFKVDGSEGNVGIGTSSPSYKLDIDAGAGNIGAIIRSSDSVAQISFRDNATGGDSNVRLGATGTNMTFFTDDAEKMRITSAGNVGIGTSSPNYKLEVNSASESDATVITTSNSNSATLSTYNSNASSGNFMQMRSYGAGTSGTIFGSSIAKANMLWSNNDALMAIGTIGATPLIIGTQNAERMRITSAGNVGIGTGSPSDKLHIEADNGGAIRLERNDPTINNGNRIGGINFAGNESGTSLIGATIEAVAAENWVSPTSYGSDIVFYQASTGTSAYAERFRFRGSGGLTFNGDSAAANALDDYEEGTFTPTVYFGTSDVGFVYSARLGKYTKVGNVVTIEFGFTLSTKGSGTGEVKIGGLPYANASAYRAGISIGNPANLSFANQFFGFVEGGSSEIYLRETTEAGVTTVLDESNFANNTSLYGSVTYLV